MNIFNIECLRAFSNIFSNFKCNQLPNLGTVLPFWKSTDMGKDRVILTIDHNEAIAFVIQPFAYFPLESHYLPRMNILSNSPIVTWNQVGRP